MTIRKSHIVPKKRPPVLTENRKVTFEDSLPFPYVHYPMKFSGVFIGFRKEEGGSILFCNCQKEGIHTYIEANLPDVPLLPPDFHDIPFERFCFGDKLCHACNSVLPSYSSGNGLGWTGFRTIYNRYIIAEVYSFGIGGEGGSIIRPELIPTDFGETIEDESWGNGRLNEKETETLIRYAENVVRRRIGYYEIGMKWGNEAKLYHLTEKLFPEYTVIHQYPQNELRLDVFVKELNVAIEYQGEQHFKSISAWGGEKGLADVQERDERKRRLCELRGIRLACINYDETLSEELIKMRVAEAIEKGN